MKAASATSTMEREQGVREEVGGDGGQVWQGLVGKCDLYSEQCRELTFPPHFSGPFLPLTVACVGSGSCLRVGRLCVPLAALGG